MKKNILLCFATIALFSHEIYSQSPTATIALWKNDAKGAYTIIHDDYGTSVVDGIWQYADTIAFNRGLKITFGAIAIECETHRNIKGYINPYGYAKNVMIDLHHHEIINHSHTHSCAVNRGWSPCDVTGWGETVGTSEWNTELVNSNNSILTGTGVAPKFYIYPYDQFTDTANSKLQSMGYIGSRTGWSIDGVQRSYPRFGYEANDLGDFYPDDKGFFRTSVQVFDDADGLKNDAGQLSTLNLGVDSAIMYGEWANRELHNVGNSGWGTVRVAPYRNHLNYVKSKVQSGDLWMGTVSEILTYQMQKLKFIPSASYSANSQVTTVNFADSKPEIAVNVADYLAPLTIKTPVTVIVDMAGMSEQWIVMQNNTSITDFTQKNGKLYINVYPHLGPLEIFKISLLSAYESNVLHRNIYPNPTTSVLNIEGDVKLVRILDLQGVEIKRDCKNTIDVSDLQDGVYLLKIDSSPLFQKFVKCAQ